MRGMQVPSHVEYARATSIGHALSLLTSPEARPLAGGHSLIPMMKLRLAQPELVVDITGLRELAYITLGKGAEGGDELRIGALTTHADLLGDDLVDEMFPILTDAERVIADPIVRNWGTVGGSLCQADPSEDLSAAFSAARATAVIATASGSRTVPVRDFHLGPYQTVIEPGELLTEIRVPVRDGTGSAYEKVERRASDWSIAAVGAVLTIEDNAVMTAGIGLTAVGAPHFAATEAEDHLTGRPGTAESFAAAAELAAAHCRPVADQRGPEDYKRALVVELAQRALARAAARAGGER